jgi:hypothetical protein
LEFPVTVGAAPWERWIDDTPPAGHIYSDQLMIFNRDLPDIVRDGRGDRRGAGSLDEPRLRRSNRWHLDIATGHYWIGII